MSSLPNPDPVCACENHEIDRSLVILIYPVVPPLAARFPPGEMERVLTAPTGPLRVVI